MPSLQQAVRDNKVKVGGAGKLRYNDLAPAAATPAAPVSGPSDPTDSIVAIASQLEGKVADPSAVASQIAVAKTEDEVKQVLASNNVDGNLFNDLLPFILGGAAAVGGGLALKSALAKRKKAKPEIGGIKNERAHKPGENGSAIIKARVKAKQPSTVDGGIIRGTVKALPAPQKQISTDIMPEEKAVTELQRVLMNMGSIGKRKGKIK